jgi:hypothetical protein
VVAVVTMDTIRATSNRRAFPREILEGSETALVLFAAAFHGGQDAIHVADAGMTATCVDTDAEKLGEMVLAYPEGWEYVTGDVFTYTSITERTWDVVTLDPPSNQFQSVADALPLWCELAKHAVLLGVGHDTTVTVPPGWQTAELRWRTRFLGGVYWQVIVPC